MILMRYVFSAKMTWNPAFINGESKRLKTIGVSAGVYHSLGLASS